MNKSLSDAEIRRFIPNVIVYSQLKDMSVEELFDMMPVVILYQSTMNRGHWTLLHEVGGGVEFFDSYSSMPDEEFKYMSAKQPHYLAKLLNKLSDFVDIHFNDKQLQELGPGINTCGRWVILRSLFSEVNIDDFVYGVRELSLRMGMGLDELVTSIIRF